jgi:hypothetical protein
MLTTRQFFVRLSFRVEMRSRALVLVPAGAAGAAAGAGTGAELCSCWWAVIESTAAAAGGATDLQSGLERGSTRMAAVTLRALSTASTNSRLGLNNRLGWALSSVRFAIRGGPRREWRWESEE